MTDLTPTPPAEPVPIRLRTGIEYDPTAAGWWVIVETGLAGTDEMDRARYGQPPAEDPGDAPVEPVPFPTEAAAEAFATVAADQVREIVASHGIVIIDAAPETDTRPRLILPDEVPASARRPLIAPGPNRAQRRHPGKFRP